MEYRLAHNIVYILLVCVSLIGCVSPSAAPLVYFPDTAFHRDYDGGQFVRNWYSKQLTALGERSLFNNKDPDKSYYRFLWLRTFDNPASVRIEKPKDGDAVLYFKMADGAGGYDPGKLVKNSERVLNPKEFEAFLVLFEAITVCTDSPDEIVGNDGSQWIFEHHNGRKYCAADKWSPSEGPHYELGIYLLNLAGFEETEDQPIY